MTLASILLIGVLLGMKHALEADHIAAVASLATRHTRVADVVRQGVVWGMGHTITLMTVCGGVLLIGAAIPVHFAQGLEIAVGIMLIGLGSEVLWRLRRARIHFHAHRHFGRVHLHAHSHKGESEHKYSLHQHEHAKRLPMRPLAVGMMHGLAGSAVLVLLSLEAIHSPAWGVVYIALFGVGSIVGMAVLSVVIGISLRLSAAYLSRAHSLLNAGVGVATVLIGAHLIYHIAVIERLLI
ncbi:MAG: urease accessory protein [Gammaproteobacteria bacterium]|nr:urease accessory protein [Gammaproteobacteria bacterium]